MNETLNLEIWFQPSTEKKKGIIEVDNWKEIKREQ